MAEKVSRDRGYRSDTIAISRDMVPLRTTADLDKRGNRALVIVF